MTNPRAEEWKPSIVPKYMVSNFGRVLNGHTGRILKSQLSINGYPRICLRLPDRSKKYIYVHRLVADAFIGAIPPEHQVNHKDCNKTNNHISNLEYVTRMENLKHGWANGRKCTGEKHGSAKLTELQVTVIRASESSQVDIAKAFGVHRDTIWRIKHNKRWNGALKSGEAKRV